MRYPNTVENWEYVLTKNRNHSIDKNAVAKNLGVSVDEINRYGESLRNDNHFLIDPNSPLNQILEVGTYQKDVHPDVVKWTKHSKIKFLRKTGRDGNVYGIDDNSTRGVFYIDTGMLKNYFHPAEKLEVSGFMDEMTPPWMNQAYR